ncbi:MAG: hypothetical protein V1696_02985 [Candidatus Jorgensenbacteria bacterium]
MDWILIFSCYAVGVIVTLILEGIIIHDLIEHFDRAILQAVGWPVVLVILLWRLLKFIGSWALVLAGVPFVRFLFGPNLPKRHKEE